MKSLQVAGVTVALAVAAWGGAEGQNSGRVFRPAQTGTRQASPPIRQALPAPATPAYPSGLAYPRYPVAYTALPAIVMSDGSIYANLGNGYVPVRQACAPLRVVNGNDLLYSGATLLTYMQPAPAQATASQLNLPSAQAQRAAAQQQVRSACYRMNPYGPVVVVR